MTPVAQVGAVPSAPWLLLLFSLPANQASARVEIWRKLKTSGALSLPTAGHLLPNSVAHRERFEWLAEMIRQKRGHASVAEVCALDGLAPDEIRAMFTRARNADFTALTRELKRL